MARNNKFSFPWQLLVFDIIGAVLVAVGFYQYVSDGRGIFYIFTGILLMLPLVVHIIYFSRQTKK